MVLQGPLGLEDLEVLDQLLDFDDRLLETS